jgi:pimeloyl-ACP methyl ester carboxylesterase
MTPRSTVPKQTQVPKPGDSLPTEYPEINGVRTWFEEHGSGEPLVALHPGLVDARAFGPNISAWADRFHVFTPERRGHGHTPDVDGPLTFKDMTADTAAFIETVVGQPCRLLGCSDGAIVALLTALLRPDLVTRLVLIAGPAHHGGWYEEAIDPDNKAPEFMYEMYGELSPDGLDHYPVVLSKMAQTHLLEPTVTAEEMARVFCRTIVMVADDDEVRLEHAIAMYRSLPKSELAVVPGTSHGLLVEKVDLCNQIILEFLENEPIKTLAPIRRRKS